MIAAEPRLNFILAAFNSTIMTIFAGGHARRGYERKIKI
jgi:hypothetical protein